MKKFFLVSGIVVISLILVTVFKDLIIKSMVTNVASRMIGTQVQMDGFSMDIFSSTIHITGFKMYNPTGFPEGVLVSCPKINVVFDRNSLFTSRHHFLLVEIELKEMVLTKNKEGKLNVDSLKIVQQSKSSPPAPMQIDLLNLSIGKIVYIDYTVGAKPSIRVFDVNRHKSYKNVPSAQQLALLVLSEPMKAAAIKGAEIYGVVMLAGVAVLPVAIVATFIGQDSVQQIINDTFDHVFAISLGVLKDMGRITKEDASNGVIKANINGSMVAIELQIEDHKTKITISARKYMLPALDIAGGVLYQINEKF